MTFVRSSHPVGRAIARVDDREPIDAANKRTRKSASENSSAQPMATFQSGKVRRRRYLCFSQTLPHPSRNSPGGPEQLGFLGRRATPFKCFESPFVLGERSLPLRNIHKAAGQAVFWIGGPWLKCMIYIYMCIYIYI